MMCDYMNLGNSDFTFLILIDFMNFIFFTIYLLVKNIIVAIVITNTKHQQCGRITFNSSGF